MKMASQHYQMEQVTVGDNGSTVTTRWLQGHNSRSKVVEGKSDADKEQRYSER
ncbi:hypothetical protein [Ligilactobacillus salivarius]|uniref:hypothetical protein n=1 Tax=Ligilactobacillus salivarius TaxID=1624 RepID=UPI0015E8120D|nr:hypothetical protein [Ligilactobacillus salivarius]